MLDYRDYKFLLACGTVDMRKSINGLLEIVCSQFALDERDKIVFAFCNTPETELSFWYGKIMAF